MDENIHTRAVFSKLSAVIQNMVATDAVYLLGHRSTSHFYENIYQPALTETPKTVSVVWILVVAALDDKPSYEWQDRIEAHCNRIASTTLLVLDSSIFRQWLVDSHPFACYVTTTAKSLFLKEDFHALNSISKQEQLKDLDACLKKGRSAYLAFRAAAELLLLRKENRIAAFMLHQATEQALHTILKANTGFHYRTHNLNRLFAYTSLVYEELFNYYQPLKDEKILEQLNKAYSKSRYDEDFSVDAQDLVKLMDIVKSLEAFLLKVKSSCHLTH